jgi:hypothetical protein
MATLRLPRFLTDKNVEQREVAIVRFAEENNDILRKQYNLMTQLGETLKGIEQMVYMSLDYEKRKMMLDLERAQMEKLADIEASREAANARNQSRDMGGGSLAAAATKLGIKGFLGALLFGFVGELLNWGKTIGEWRDKLVGWLVNLQGHLDAFGDKIEELTGSNVLGGLVRSLIPITAALTAIATVFGPARVLRTITTPLRLMFGFLKDIGTKIAPLLRGINMAKIMSFVRVFGRATLVIGLVITAIEGLIGAVQGALAGWEENGIVGAIGGFFSGFWTTVAEGILETLQQIGVWLLGALGFDNLASALEDVDPSKLVDKIVEGVGDVFKWIGDKVSDLFNAILNFDYMGLLNTIIDSLPIPDAVKTGFKRGLTMTTAAVSSGARFVAGQASEAWDATRSGWNRLTGAVTSARDSLDQSAGDGLRSASSGITRDPVAMSPVTAMTGNMTGGTATSAQVGAGQASGDIDVDALWNQVSPMIASGEAVGSDPYNTQNGVPGSITPGLTDMTLQQVHDRSLEIGRSDGNGPKTGAAGKYQFIPSTLIEAARMAGLSMTDKFTPANQEKMARAKFDQRVKQGRRGGVDGILDALSQEWASLPSPSKGGASWYDGIAGNKAHGGSARLTALRSAVSGSSLTPAPAASGSSGPALSSATSTVAAMSATAGSGSAPAVVSAPRTNVNNTTTHHHASNISASTPVEFAPHVV